MCVPTYEDYGRGRHRRRGSSVRPLVEETCSGYTEVLDVGCRKNERLVGENVIKLLLGGCTPTTFPLGP